MKKFASIGAAVVLAYALSSCHTLVHEVGKGAQGSSEVEKRQWYILYGLIPLNDTDSKAMAHGATDYTIKSEQNIIDILLNIVTGFVTINSQTVTVTR